MPPRSIIAVALQLLTACSFASKSSSYAPRPLGADIAGRRTALVYVSDHTNNLIDVFDRSGNLQYTISSGLNEPAGLSVDAQHNLWVANPGANDVLVFPRGSMDPARTLNDTNQPNDVAVCDDGTAFVADSRNEGGVAVYPPGRKAPARRLIAQQSGAGGVEFYVTCDKAGNIFCDRLHRVLAVSSNRGLAPRPRIRILLVPADSLVVERYQSHRRRDAPDRNIREVKAGGRGVHRSRKADAKVDPYRRDDLGSLG